MKPQTNLSLISDVLSRCGPVFGPLPVLQAQSFLRRPLHKCLAGHPQIRQREQRDQLRGVLGQPPIAHLGVAELALDQSEGMLDLGTCQW